MKKLFTFVILSIIFYSCSRNGETPPIEPSPICKVTSANPLNYYYDDITLSYTFGSDLFRYKFEYDTQNRISKVYGSLSIAPSQGPGVEYYLSKDSYDEITYLNGITYVKVAANQIIRPYDKEFVIINDKIVSRSETSLYPFGTLPKVKYKYEYVGNTVLEKYDGILNDRLVKTLTIESGNLTKVEKWKYDNSGNILGKEEIVFSNYDTNENLLQGKFFLNGYFYHAFSKNQFYKVESNYYNYINGQFVFNSMLFQLNIQQGTLSNYFEKICN